MEEEVNSEEEGVDFKVIKGQIILVRYVESKVIKPGIAIIGLMRVTMVLSYGNFSNHCQNSFRYENSPAHAMLATSTLQKPLQHDWHPDSGATNPLNSKAINLVQKVPYNGKEKVVIGDGSVCVSHI